VSHNKPTTKATSSVCGSESSYHMPQIVIFHKPPDYIGAHRFKHALSFHFWQWLQNCLWIFKFDTLFQRFPNFLDAGPNWRSYQHSLARLFCVL